MVEVSVGSTLHEVIGDGVTEVKDLNKGTISIFGVVTLVVVVVLGSVVVLVS